MQRRARYQFSTFVLVAFFVFAILKFLLAQFIPEGVDNALADENATFLHQAGNQRIDWHPLNERSIAMARRLNRPILLVIGAPWSIAGRRLDKEVFSDSDVQKMLARNYVCIRVDAVESPDWFAGYLPVGRAQLGAVNDVQVYVLDSVGRMFDQIGPQALWRITRAPTFLGRITLDVAQFAKFESMPNLAMQPHAPGTDQAANLALFRAIPPRDFPDFQTFAKTLIAESSRTPGAGFPVGDAQLIDPPAWQYLLLAAGVEACQTSFDPILTTPVVDLLDGGFFRGAASADWQDPSYDKVSVLNAEMAAFLARLYARSHDPKYAHFARAAFDAVAYEAADSHDDIRPCRLGDEDFRTGRSAHSSFSPRDQRALFNNADQLKWIRDNLGLRLETNKPLVPKLTSLDLLNGDQTQLNAALNILRSKYPKPPFDNEITMSVSGACVARLYEAARILGDRDRINRAALLFERLGLFVSGNDVAHGVGISPREIPTLGDYLAYADAALQDFLTLGRVPSLLKGLSVLRRGLFLFKTDEPGCFAMGQNTAEHRALPDSNPPEIVDDCGESASAKVIRLAEAYGMILSPNGAPIRDLNMIAIETTSRFATVLEQPDHFMAGYFSAAAMVQDSRYVVAVGRDPVEMATALAPEFPFRLIAPGAGPVRPDLQHKAPGYYVVASGQTSGPLTPAQLHQALPAWNVNLP